MNEISHGALGATARAIGLAPVLLAGLLACARAAGPAGGERLYFSDDLRVWSVGADGTAPVEFPGKPTSSPVPTGDGGVLCASYRGPYLFFDPLQPGIYRTDWRGGHRRRVMDFPVLPALEGRAGDTLLCLFAGTANQLVLLDPRTRSRHAISLPARALAAAASPDGKRAAVVLEPRLRTVMLGNQAWFTEGSDLLLVPLNGGPAVQAQFPTLPAELARAPALENYTAAGMAAVDWLDGHRLLVSSSPGIWRLELDAPGGATLVRPRAPGTPPADGLRVSPDGRRLAITAAGRLLVRDLTTGAERDVTPPSLVGGARHPAWMGAVGSR